MSTSPSGEQEDCLFKYTNLLRSSARSIYLDRQTAATDANERRTKHSWNET